MPGLIIPASLIAGAYGDRPTVVHEEQEFAQLDIVLMFVDDYEDERLEGLL